jgi:hemoglobin
MTTMRNGLILSGLIASILLGACGGSKKAETTPVAPEPAPVAEGEKKSLYERLGGLEAITAVIDEFLVNVLADERINARFANADKPRLRQMLIDQLCEATGGPCKYAGKNMVESHAGMNITEDEFNALVEDLVKALDKFKVPEAEKNELLGALGGMKGDIVGK